MGDVNDGIGQQLGINDGSPLPDPLGLRRNVSCAKPEARSARSTSTVIVTIGEFIRVRSSYAGKRHRSQNCASPFPKLTLQTTETMQVRTSKTSARVITQVKKSHALYSYRKRALPNQRPDMSSKQMLKKAYIRNRRRFSIVMEYVP